MHMGSGDDQNAGTVRQEEPPVAVTDERPERDQESAEREQTREMGTANDGKLAREQHDAPRQTAGGTYSFLGPIDESGQRSFAAEEAGANIRAYERDRNPAYASGQPLRDPADIEPTPEPKGGGSTLANEEPPKPTRFDREIDEVNKSEPGDE